MSWPNGLPHATVQQLYWTLLLRTSSYLKLQLRDIEGANGFPWSLNNILAHWHYICLETSNSNDGRA